MRLYEAIKELVEKVGINIIIAKPFVNILDDIGAFKMEPAASKKVMRGLLGDGFGEQLVRISEQKEVNWQNHLNKRMNDYALKSGYKDELINNLTTQILYAIGVIDEVPPSLVDENTSDSEQKAFQIDDYKALIDSYLMSINIDAPKVAPIGEPFTLKWISSGAKQVSILGIGGVDLEGQRDMTLSESSDFTFELTSATGIKTEKTIFIKVAKRGVVNLFEAERTYTFSSVPVRISWNCSNMIFVELVGYGKQPTIGSLEVEINQDKTFELRTKDHFNTFSQTITVRVLPYPSIKTICVPQFEGEYTHNATITIHNAHLDIRPLVSKVNASFPVNSIWKQLTIHNSKIGLPRSLAMFSGEVKDTMRNLFNITSNGFTQIVNQIKQAINERD